MVVLEIKDPAYFRKFKSYSIRVSRLQHIYSVYDRLLTFRVDDSCGRLFTENNTSEDFLTNTYNFVQQYNEASNLRQNKGFQFENQ